jgi:hypothetical protein
MTTDIEIITCLPEPVGESTKIGTEEFTTTLLAEFHKKKPWRSLVSLANALHVDPQQLSQWLDKNPQVMRRAGKEDGVFYYCWSERVTKPKTSTKSDPTNRVVREEDRYALGMLHMVYFQLYRVLKTYGLEISQRDAEAFGNLTASLDKLESGLLLFSKKTKASMDKLPKFN